MKERFAKLIDVKSLMTLALTIVFCALALMGAIGATEFLSIFTMIVGFYFGTQSQKAAAVTGLPVEQVSTLPPVSAPTAGATPESTMSTLYPPDNA